MFLFIFGLIFLAAALAVLLTKVTQIREEEVELRGGYRTTERRRVKAPIPFRGLVVPVLGLIGLALIAGSVTTTVNAKTEGVLLTFKRPSERLLEPGLAFKAPWQDVVEIDGTRKTDNFNDGEKNAEDDPTQDHASIQCRLGDNGVAKVKASVQWSRAEGVSNRVFEQYRSDDPVAEMRENLVVPRFRDAVNQTCGEYKPTAVIDNLDIDFSDPQAVSNALRDLDLAPNFANLSADAKERLERLLQPANGEEALVTVENVSISYLELPETSQSKIDRFLEEVNNTRIALQAQATNAAQAQANKILSDSISNDPYVLVAQCFDLIRDGKLKLPAGSTCWPGSNSSVVIPSAR